MDIISRILKSVEDFPTLPTVYTALTDVMANPRATSQDAAAVIIRDQSAASKVLKTANSPLYGFRGRIDTISQAIFHIGFEEVKNLVIAISIMDIFKHTKLTNSYNPVELWKHSIAVGVITKLIGKELGVKNLENYFLAGILHDIGKLLFLKELRNEYEKTLQYAMDKRISIKDAEAETLGITHTIAGELVSEKWKLPAPLRNAIKYHYSGIVDGEVKFLPASVHIANVASRILELGEAGDDLIPEPNFTVWKALKLSDDFFTKNLGRIMLDYETSMTLFAIT